MRATLYLIVSFLLVSAGLFSQDNIFLRNGTRVKAKIVALSEHTVSYRDSLPDSPITTISKKDILMLEYKSGMIFIFGSEQKPSEQPSDVSETREQRKERKLKEWKEKEKTLSDNILGIYLPELAVGRFTLSYERLLSNKTIGIKIPVSLTYNPFYLLASGSSTNGSNVNYGPQGVSFITGIDVNYYHDLKPELKYYFGPRIRYGTDMLLGGIQGLTVQLQNGIFKSRGDNFTSTFGVGVGFFTPTTIQNNASSYEPKQVYPWGSVTWRLGFRL